MKTIDDTLIKATCAACQREFWATEAYVQMAQAGRVESLCGGCDGSHAIDEAEYKHGDR